MPIPDHARAAAGSDGQLVVMDLSTRKSYEFWQYNNDRATRGPDIYAPAAPTLTTATRSGLRSLTLKWSPSTGESGAVSWRVWRGDADWANWVQVGEVGAASRSFTNRSVQIGRTYPYVVRVQDAAGNSAPSNAVLARN